MEKPSFPELLSSVDERSAALREAVASAPDLDARVPSCPDWSLRDLVAHLGAVHRFWTAAVRAADDSARPAPEAVGDAEPHGDLLDWSAGSARMLLAALGEAGPDSPCWTWWAESGAPMTAGAVARHQAQEAAVHAWDAQKTIGKPEPIPASVAVDAVAEFLEVTLGSQGAWPHRPARITFSAIEGPSWTVDVTPSGSRLDPPASGEPVATVHGSASDILLVLFGRLDLDRVRVDGDQTVVEDLLAWANTD